MKRTVTAQLSLMAEEPFGWVISELALIVFYVEMCKDTVVITVLAGLYRLVQLLGGGSGQ